MKIKLYLVYIGVGIAFAAVSLWVFLSNGRSARAVNAKYKLGGILLTTMTMISAASCNGNFFITCYEPVEPQVMCYDVPAMNDVITMTVNDKADNSIKVGETMTFQSSQPTVEEYRFRIHSGDATAPVFQEFSCQIPEEDKWGLYKFEQVLGQTDYKGEATISVFMVLKKADDSEEERELEPIIIRII